MQNNSNMNSNSEVSDRELNSVDAEEENEETHHNFVERLPSEITEKIFSYLDCQSLGRASMTCKSWNSNITTSVSLWKHLCSNLKPNCETEIENDLKSGYSYRETFLRNYQKYIEVTSGWDIGIFSDIPSFPELPENSMCTMSKETWGDILDKELKRDAPSIS
ncbi:F-box only protein 48-like isoform X1 [Saccopteryx leptura]|uniref:F-box only protein 48-like isoform X1 n=1 Tax=Saccopteryx leptura TaxID=249018 RepID=UPI00339CCFBF